VRVGQAGQMRKKTQDREVGLKIIESLATAYVKACVWLRELQNRLTRGQTMTEYALILGAVAVVCFVTYEVMGQNVKGITNKVDSALTTT
jgi:Flp pilus assembly pilin Flp